MSTISNPAELRRRGIEVLVRELGYAVRFLQQFGAGRGDYTADRDRHGSPPTAEEQADKLADQEHRRRAAG